MHIPELFYRGKKLIAWWPDSSHDISCSNLSSTESMASTIPELGLKRMRLILLLIIICIFVGIKKIVDCSAWATKIVSKEMLQTYVNIFHSENMMPYISMKKLWRQTFAHNPIEMEWCLAVGMCKQLSAGKSSLQEAPFVLSLLKSYIVIHLCPSTPFKSFDDTNPCLTCWFFP